MTVTSSSAPAPAVAPAGTGELLQLLLDGVPRTRAELASQSGLSRSTVAARVDALLDAGLITGVGEAASSGGRPPSRFAFEPRAAVVVAIDLGATHGVVAITDLAGDVLVSQRAELSIADGPGPVLDRSLALVLELLGRAGREPDEVLGIGIGLPGPVAHDTGRPANPPIMPGWHDFDVPAYVRAVIDVPTFVDNDVNIMALGEQRIHWPDRDDLLFVKVATGIGAGLISNGRLQRGADGTAGDLGHVRVARGSDVVCRCGNVGCLEALAGAPALVAELASQGLPVTRAADVVRLMSDGDPAAVAALRQAGRDLGEVLATCVNLLNPSVIVLGGVLGEAGDQLLAGVREVVYLRSLPLATLNLVIVPTVAGDDAGVIGASMLVLQSELTAEAVDARLAARG
jgi:predicted NBD/HSP70 family sugar kinase